MCPNCGYCPHCGRAAQMQPLYPWNQPFWAIPANPPYWYGNAGNIAVGVGNSGTAMAGGTTATLGPEHIGYTGQS